MHSARSWAKSWNGPGGWNPPPPPCTKYKVDHCCPLWTIQTNKATFGRMLANNLCLKPWIILTGLLYLWRVWLLIFYEILARQICKDYVNVPPPLQAVTWLRHNVEFNVMPLSVGFISIYMHKGPRAPEQWEMGWAVSGPTYQPLESKRWAPAICHLGEERMVVGRG